MKTATDILVKKHFKVDSFDAVLKHINKKDAAFFTSTVFMDKPVFISYITKLAKEINDLSEAYKTAQEASKSGSFMQGFASAGLGSIQKEYISKRKAMVHHVSLFVARK